MPKKASKKKLGYSIFTDPEFMEKYRDLVLSFQDGLSEDDLEGENELLLPNYNRTRHKGLSRPNLQVQQP